MLGGEWDMPAPTRASRSLCWVPDCCHVNRPLCLHAADRGNSSQLLGAPGTTVTHLFGCGCRGCTEGAETSKIATNAAVAATPPPKLATFLVHCPPGLMLHAKIATSLWGHRTSDASLLCTSCCCSLLHIPSGFPPVWFSSANRRTGLLAYSCAVSVQLCCEQDCISDPTCGSIDMREHTTSYLNTSPISGYQPVQIHQLRPLQTICNTDT